MANSLGKLPETILREYALAWPDYELLDAGDGKKLERWRALVTIRPDLQASFKAGWPDGQWQHLAHWEFIEHSPGHGSWKSIKPDSPEQWLVSYGKLNFGLKLTQFKHVGLFPEQQANWHFIRQHLRGGQKFLNLFAYSGAASLIARDQGADVVHVDSVKQMITWANENMQRSALSDIKWVLEDALKFARREVKRGNTYDGIIMDPPAWGLGVKGERWKLENHLSELLETAHRLMNPGAFLILNTYSPKITLTDLAKVAEGLFLADQLEIKQLWMSATSGNGLYCGNVLRGIKGKV
jgi:23S rRNA (cytosine1962-C5)-methyltransferase